MSSPAPPPLDPPPRLSAERVQAERERIAAGSRGAISTGRWMWEWIKAIATAILLFLIVRTFVVEAFKIPTGSMERTLMVGDFLLVNKAVYGAEVPSTHVRLPAFREPDRGDVVVFLPPHDPGKTYVKRLVGTEGDTLEMRDKVLYRNGEPQIEPYIRHIDPLTDPSDPRMAWQSAYLVGGVPWRGYHPSRDNWGPITVPPGRYFVLGDNRDNSEDSRYWGFLELEAVRGSPMFIYYSFQRNLARPFSWLTGIRWNRIGHPVE
jgi:signal peptidase I